MLLFGLLFIAVPALGAFMAIRTVARRGAQGEHALAAVPGAGTAERPRAHVRTRRRSALRTPEPTVSVVIPTLNEEDSLPWVLEHLPRGVMEVVLIDGLSTDRTEALARRIRPDVVVVHQLRPGKGAALRAGFAAARGDIIVMLDADGSTDPREMPRFLAALADGADFVKGSRYADGGGSADITRLRSLGNRGFVLLANVLYGCRFTDLCYGYCAFWRRHVEALALTSDGFEIETELVLAAVRARLETREVPSFELPRRAGVSNLNAVTDGTRVLRTMLGERWRWFSHRAAAAAEFTLRRTHLPVWSTDAVPAEGERRRGDRRRLSREESGYVGPERRVSERRRTVGTVVAWRAVYGGGAPAVSVPVSVSDEAPDEVPGDSALVA
jgi:glycosyltransferase involved in cell wall biosynthesis